MKLLFDQNLSFKLCHVLSDLFPNSTHVRLIGLSDASDRVIRQHAPDQGFTLVSLDSDFAEMAALFGQPPKTIWLRCGNQTTAFVESLIRRNVAAIRDFSQNEAVCLEIYG